jgi:uncharacterized membrane protein YtjA (UPF0391 family)
VNNLLYWTFIFLILALVAGALGFGNVAQSSSSIARVLFFIFIVLFLLSLVFGGGFFVG